jgi:alpha-beta hydrolase superfamily lysophospholipase
MKLFISLLAFQMLVQFTYGQNVDSLKKEEIQKDLEQQLFPGSKFQKDFHFKFSEPFVELNILTKDGYKLNGILFKAKQSKGLIFYLHGSNDALNTWGKIAPVYINLNYDIFILDYRGYGKSESKVTSERQLSSDIQTAYNKLKQTYPESKIIVIGQSMGTGPAAMLAANNKPKALILQAPYYSLSDWIYNVAPDIDTSNMKYQFKIYEFFPKIKAPVTIFHGDADDAIYYGSSEKLSSFFKKGDKLFILKGEGHNNFTNNKVYLEKMKTILQ